MVVRDELMWSYKNRSSTDQQMGRKAGSDDGTRRGTFHITRLPNHS
jgi:hypothetical protein